MNAGNKITIKSVNPDDAGLPLVIHGAVGNPSPDKIVAVIKRYAYPGHEIIGAFTDDILVGMLGVYIANALITIRHISVLQNFQRQGVGTLLLGEIKKCYEGYRIIAETDEESVGFYAKSGFSCHGFKGKYGNLRYKCEFYTLFSC